MEEYELHSLEGLADELFGRSERAMREAIRAVKVALTLNADGDCMFRIDDDDEEYNSWYVRKKALEDVFFPTENVNV